MNNNNQIVNNENNVVQTVQQQPENPNNTPNKNGAKKVILIIVIITALVTIALVVWLVIFFLGAPKQVENIIENPINNIENVPQEDDNYITNDWGLYSDVPITDTLSIWANGTVKYKALDPTFSSDEEYELTIVGKVVSSVSSAIINNKDDIKNATDYTEIIKQVEKDALDHLQTDWDLDYVEYIEIKIDKFQPKKKEAAMKFTADIHLLSKSEGGRHTPILNEYSPNVCFKEICSKGVFHLLESELYLPGDDGKATIDLEKEIDIKVGDTFEIIENDKVIGTGTVTKINE